jgi:hypothetical protein
MKTKLLLLAFAGTIFSCNNFSNESALQKLADSKEKQMETSEGFLSATDSSAFLNETRQEDEKTPQTPRQKPKPSEQPKSPNIDWDKKIIRTATLNAEVKDYRAYYSMLRSTVKQFGGYIAQEQQNQSAYQLTNTVIIKVPVEQFDHAVTALTPESEKIIERKITSADVTGEVVDTKSRMEAKRQVRLRYLDLLKQAKNMEEILQVQNEINDIQEQIESADGRLNYLTHSAAFSTINLTFFQVLDAGAKDTTDPGFWQKIIIAFKNGWSFVGDLVVGLVNLWPLWLMIIGVVTVYNKARTRKIKPVS